MTNPTPKTRPVLVTGATGTQGGAVARLLLERGHAVRALTRDPDQPAAKLLAERGAELVVADFDDPDSLRRAAAGTAAVFAMGTWTEGGAEAEARQSIALIDAITAAGTGHIVYSSVASALDGTGVPHFESKAQVERHLAATGTPATVVAPTAFLENVFAPWSASALAKGQYLFPLPSDVPLQQVAIADLAEFVALVLEQPERYAGQRVELASVEVTGEQFAAALSRWLGREVAYVETPVDAADEDMRTMTAFFRERGYQVDIPALRAAYPQVAWRDLETWGAQQDWSEWTAG